MHWIEEAGGDEVSHDRGCAWCGTDRSHPHSPDCPRLRCKPGCRFGESDSHPPECVVSDPINPQHYTFAGAQYEHYQVMIATGLYQDGFLYNCTKYLWRLGRKDGAPKLQDLEKARWYLDKRIELEKELIKQMSTKVMDPLTDR